MTDTSSPGAPPDPAGSEPLGPNAWLVEEIFEQYQSDPQSVSATWRDFFADYVPPGRPAAVASATTPARPRARTGLPVDRSSGTGRSTDHRPGRRRSHSACTLLAQRRRRRGPGGTHPRRRGADRPEHGGQPRGADRHVVQGGAGQTARGQPPRHQRVPRPHPWGQGQLHPPHRLRRGARRRGPRPGHEQHLRRGTRRRPAHRAQRARRAGPGRGHGEEGRQPHVGRPGHQGRGHHGVRGVHRRLRRAHPQGQDQQAHRRRLRRAPPSP